MRTTQDNDLAGIELLAYQDISDGELQHGCHPMIASVDGDLVLVARKDDSKADVRVNGQTCTTENKRSRVIVL